MKALKSIVLLTVGVLALSACDQRRDTQTSAIETEESTTMGAGTTDSDLEADPEATDLDAAGTGAASDSEFDSTTEEGAGAVSDEAVTEDLGTDQGSGSSQNMEYVDETSSEPDQVEGGREPRMIERNTDLDNTSSEPDIQE